MNGSNEWKAALRLQIEALAKRNDLHRRYTVDSVKKRTQAMDKKIVRLRELLSSDANLAAQYYLECVCHADETERILNRTSSRDQKKKKKNKVIDSNTSSMVMPWAESTVETAEIAIPLPRHLEDRPSHSRWADQLKIHRKAEDYGELRNERRQIWSNQRDFALNSLAFVVGVGNIVRFPAAVYNAGGGVFYLPYLIFQLLIGFPMIYLQMVIGQYAGTAAPMAFSRLSPAAMGLGWTTVLIGIIFCIYYSLYISWFFYFFFQTVFAQEIPWETCPKNATSCCSILDMKACNFNGSLLSTQYYFQFTCLFPSSSSLAAILPSVAGCMTCAWLLTLFLTLRSTSSSSKLINVTSTLPFFVLLLLVMCGLSLPGAPNGLAVMMSTDISKLARAKVWLSAIEQVIFELGLLGCPIVALSSMNRFRNNIYRDAALTTAGSTIASFLSACFIFSLLGQMSMISGKDVLQISEGESRYLSFTVIPALTSTTQAGALWASIAFLAFAISAAASQCAWITSLTSSILENFSSRNRLFETRLIVALCGLGFLLGLPMCSKAGIMIFHAIDSLIASWPAFIIIFLIAGLVSYIYGAKNLSADITAMLRLDKNPKGRVAKLMGLLGPAGKLLQYSWSVIVPLTMTIFFILYLITIQRTQLKGHRIPWYFELAAWVVVGSPLLITPIMFLHGIYMARRNGKTLRSLFDSSLWSQGDSITYGSEPSLPPSRQISKQQRNILRENTYMYIDPLSRGNTSTSNAYIPDNNYSWRLGRLKELQNQNDDEHLHVLSISESQPSFATSMTSQGTTIREFTLFGSPPVSNAFMLSDISNKNKVRVEVQQPSVKQLPDEPHEERRPKSPASEPPIKMHVLKPSCSSEPPVAIGTPQPSRASPARSAPPVAIKHPPAIRPRSASASQASSSQDELSTSDEEGDDGINPQRRTVIRRYCSEDSFGPQSNASLSITPIDAMVRQRSISSVAIYEEKQTSGTTQKLSQLKRPKPIDAPPPPQTRF